MCAYSRLIIFLWLITFGLISTAMLIAQRLPRAAELAYVSSAGLHPAIYRMEIERNLHVPLTDDAFAAYAPAWSPDGEFIAYYAIREGSRDLYLMNALGRDVRRLTNNAAVNESPAWSPDGTRLAFASDYGGSYGIFTLELNCQQTFEQCAHRITPIDDFWYASPHWSPDGTQIVFASTRSSNPLASNASSDIFVIRQDGTNLRLLAAKLGEDYSPAWSPDGAHIIFAGQSIRTRNMTIYQVPTSCLDLPAGCADQVQEHISGIVNLTPVWSPDGHWIIFTSIQRGNFEIFLASADGNNLRQLTQTPADESSPRWRP